MAQELDAKGWAAFKAAYVADETMLGQLAWMGEANRRFLARNLGLARVGKPDRWLLRLADFFGFASLDSALSVIEASVGDDPGLADAYIWAYLSENPAALDG